MKVLTLALLGCALCRGQATNECRPSTLNVPGAPYPCVYADHRATFRLVAPDAQKVQVRVGRPFDMAKGDDGVWTVTTTPLVEGFHYYSLVVDGVTMADPATRTFFGSGWDNSGIEIPEAADVLLLIEVSDSSLAFDQGAKLSLYARYGVAEYWIVDVEGRRIVTYHEPSLKGYARTLEFSGADRVAPLAFPDVKIVIGEIFG